MIGCHAELSRSRQLRYSLGHYKIFSISVIKTSRMKPVCAMEHHGAFLSADRKSRPKSLQTARCCEVATGHQCISVNSLMQPFPPFILKTPILWFQRFANPPTKAWFLDVYGGYNISSGMGLMCSVPLQKHQRKKSQGLQRLTCAQTSWRTRGEKSRLK